MTPAERAAWLAERRSGVGGSDVPAIVGASPWRSPLDVYLDKVGLAEPQPETEPMRWGTLLEAVVAQEYARRLGVAVVPGPGMLRHPDRPWAFANVDRLVAGGGRGVEIKTTGYADAWGEPGTDQMPPYVVAQVAWYAGITGIAEWDVPVLISGSDFRVYHYRRDPELEEMLFDAAGRFWHEHVLAMVPPAPRSVAEAAVRWPRDTGAEVYASAEAVAAVAELARLKAEIKRLEAEAEGYELAVKSEMGEASALLADGGGVLATWKASVARRVDLEALKAAHPDIHERFRVESSSRRFLVKSRSKSE